MAKRPKGAFGISWGDDAASAAKKLGLTCDRWLPWGQESEFVTCGGDAEILQRKAHVDLVAANQSVEGLIVSYREEYDDVVRDVEKELGVSSDSPPLYTAWSSGEVVRLEVSPAGGCFLTVAGPRFGRAVRNDILREGFAQFAAGVKP